MSFRNQRPAPPTLVPDTPDTGRSRRQSTKLVSAATRSVLLQSASSPSNSKPCGVVEDTPDNTVNFKGSKFVEDTPDVDETVFDTSQIPETLDRMPKKSILKTKHGPTKVRNLPTLLPGEETFVAQSQVSALSSTVVETGSGPVSASPGSSGKKRGRKPRVSSTTILDMSGINPLTPEAKSAKKAEDKRRSRRSNVSREQFLSFVFNKEASPPPPEKSPPKKNLSVISDESESSDDGWEALKNSDGSIKKYLPKSSMTRKSVVISGNVKSKTKKQLSAPKSQRNKKVIKNLSDELNRKSIINETIAEGNSAKQYNTILDESNITFSRRQSRHGTLVEEVSHEENERSSAQEDKSRPGSNMAMANLSMNSDNYERTRLPLSFQNFSTDSAKAMIAAMERGEYQSNISDEHQNTNSSEKADMLQESQRKGRGRPKRSSFFAANFDEIDTPDSKKRKSEELQNGSSKKSKKDLINGSDSPMEIISSVAKQNPFRPPINLKGGEKTSLTPQPMEMDTPSPARRSGRDSTRISTIATNNAMSSPVVIKFPTDPNNLETSVSCAQTQKAPILDGVVVFVDFRAEHENRGNVIKNAAQELGATILDKLTPEVTHVIFKDGSRFNFQKAKKSGIPILSAGWLEESKKQGRKMPENDFPSVSIEKYNSPGLFPKLKKMKSMQPKSIDEDFEAASKAQDRKQKMLEKKLLREKEAKKIKEQVSISKYPPHDHYFKGSPYNRSKSPTRKSKSNPDASLNGVLREFQTPTGTPVKLQKLPPHLLSPTSPSDGDYDTPLARRLANRYQSPVVMRNNLSISKSMPVTPGPEDSALVTSNLDTTQKLRKGNSNPNETSKEIPEILVDINKTLKVDETLDESPMRRSKRSTTAISTLATSQVVAQEINKKDIEAGQELFEKVENKSKETVEAAQSPDYKELLPSPVLTNRRRGRPKKAIDENGGSNNTTFGNPQLESTRLAPKNIALSKTSVGEPQLESTRLAPKYIALSKTSFGEPQLESTRIVPNSSSVKPPGIKAPTKFTSVSNSKPKTPTAAENDLMFNALVQGKPELSPPTTVQKQKKFVLSSTKKVSKPASDAEPSKDLSINSISLNKTPRLVAPWRHLGDLDEPEKAAAETVTDDVCEFSGFPDEPPSKKTDSVPVSRRKSREKQKTNESSFGRPSRVKMFMVAPHGGYSGEAPGIQRKMELSPKNHLSNSPKRSPLRSPMRSPVRHALGSPRGETIQSRSPRIGFGSIRASPTYRIGSPRIDPSQRVGSPRVERGHLYSSPHSRLGGSPHRVGGSPRAYGSPKTNHGCLLVDVPSDKPGISLTGFASDYNIVAAVGKHHTTTTAIGKAPTCQQNGHESSLDAGIVASKATVVHNHDGTVSVVSKDISNIQNNLASEVNGTSKKAVLISKIFTKPPVNDDKESETKIKSVDKNESKSTRQKHKLFPQKKSQMLDQTADPYSVVTTDNVDNVHCDAEPVKRKRSKTTIRKNSRDGLLFAEPPVSADKPVKKHSVTESVEQDEEPFRKPSRKASKRIVSMREHSSDSESVDSNASEDLLSQASQKCKKLKVKKLNPPRRSSFEFAPVPKFLKKMEEKNLSQAGLSSSQKEEDTSVSSGRSRRGKSSRGNTPSPSSNIVCTSCHKDDINLVKQLIKMFGTFSFSTTVTPSTSHVVSGEGKRTLNLLKGLLQGCWIVTKEWVLSSLEESKWVDEEPYEMVDFSPAVRNVRLEKEVYKGAFKSELFKDVGDVYISNSCKAPKEELKQLILSGGGSVAKVTRIASVVVGETRPDCDNADFVTEKWVLDSVQYHVVMPFSDYPM